MIKIALLTLILFATGCSSIITKNKNTTVDFERLLSRPTIFDGKEVSTRAWLSFAHEDRNLWADWLDHENWDTRRCISLSGYDSSGLDDSWNGTYVEVTGTVILDASYDGSIIRFGACRDLALQLSGTNDIKRLPQK